MTPVFVLQNGVKVVGVFWSLSEAASMVSKREGTAIDCIDWVNHDSQGVCWTWAGYMVSRHDMQSETVVHPHDFRLMPGYVWQFCRKCGLRSDGSPAFGGCIAPDVAPQDPLAFAGRMVADPHALGGHDFAPIPGTALSECQRCGIHSNEDPRRCVPSPDFLAHQRLQPGRVASPMFHHLWTKAVGEPGYLKDEWKQLQREIESPAPPRPWQLGDEPLPKPPLGELPLYRRLADRRQQMLFEHAENMRGDHGEDYEHLALERIHGFEEAMDICNTAAIDHRLPPNSSERVANLYEARASKLHDLITSERKAMLEARAETGGESGTIDQHFVGYVKGLEKALKIVRGEE